MKPEKENRFVREEGKRENNNNPYLLGIYYVPAFFWVA